MTLVKYRNPGMRLSPIWDEFFKRSLFDSSFPSVPASTVPAVNISDNGEAYNLELAVPGLKKEDITIELEDQLLVVSGASKVEKEEDAGRYFRKEFSYASFQRKFTLPEDVDGELVEASYTDGILKVKVPRKQEKQKPGARQIDVK